MPQKSFSRKNRDTVEDITERKRADGKLKKSQLMFKALVENAFEGVSIVDSNSKVVYAGPGLTHLLGYSAQERQGKSAFDYVHSDDIAKVQERFGHLIAHPEKSLHMAFRIMHKNGAWRWVECAVRNLLDDPNVNGIVVNYRDITDRKQAEEKQQKSELKFKALIENSFEGVTIISNSGTVIYESPGLKKFLGYNSQETLGGGAFGHVHPDDMAKAQESFSRSIAHPDETTQLVVRIRHKDGSWRWVECVGRNLLEDTNINGIVINYRDITERKKDEEERQRLEQQIQQAQKLESLGVLAGGIAHDFNNLLSGIFGFIEMANAESKDSTVSAYLGTALNSIDRARNLTRQLLTFAKGGAPIRDIGSLAPLIRETAQFALSGSNISCSFDIPEDLLACNFDKNQIAQVIDNVVINAQQAMPMGGTIRISAANVHLEDNRPAMLSPGSYVKISIADTGIGIPREVLPRIFDPFFTTKQKGSGLGLTTCYSIIMRHDGWIDVESEPGRGTTFHLYLPASGESPAAALPEKTAVHRGSGRILVMDDDETVRGAFGKILMTFGYSVVGAADGRETLQVLTEETRAGRQFAAMILDLTIPGGMGGRETIAEIRKLDARLPVFVASGYAEDPILANPGKFGFTDSIRKPFRMEELSLLFNRHLPVSP